MPDITHQTESFTDLPAFLSPNQLCSIFGISKPTLFTAVERGLFPRPIKFGGKCWRFSKQHVLAFIQQEAGGITTNLLTAMAQEREGGND